MRRNPVIAGMAALLLALGSAVGVMIWNGEMAGEPAASGIAVLPFENFSDDKENAFFADGIQDDILTSLAKIHDLKVISRTSVMQYKSGIARNLRQIAQDLGVSNVVEGSVRRSGIKEFHLRGSCASGSSSPSARPKESWWACSPPGWG